MTTSQIDTGSDSSRAIPHLDLKPISALISDKKGNPCNYWIPAYQRGYRWTPLQVTQLLDDIWEWESKVRPRDPDPDQFYCLQPLVIKEEGHRFEVVDGQQRLTTILIILDQLNKRKADNYRRQLFKIDYETRPSFEGFLAKPSEEAANDDIDFYHLYHAMRRIEEWLRVNEDHVNDFESALLNRTQVIWFALGEHDDPINAFTRLNVGKIALTDDELIRALFLRSDEPTNLGKGDHERQRIAHEWDTLEQRLQSPPFWGFLSNNRERAENRIGFLFELIARSDGMPTDGLNNSYKIFNAFNARIQKGYKPTGEWLRVKEEFMRLEEWYQDRILYHIVGYLVTEGTDLNKLRRLSVGCTKSAFNLHLREMIFSHSIGKAPESGLTEEAEQEIQDLLTARLGDLEYRPNAPNREIRAMLLLFNVATLLQDKRSNIRFQFDSFKNGSWNIEHVRSVSTSPMNSYLARENWLENCRGYLKDQKDGGKELKKLISEIDDYLLLAPQEAMKRDFDPLYTRVLERFGESEVDEVEHGLANLALLDEQTNKSYKNAPFALKRARILALDQAGIFVPLCTRNVFLKCYSPRVNNAMFWGEEDQEGYLKAMVETLTGFFLGRMEGQK